MGTIAAAAQSDVYGLAPIGGAVGPGGHAEDRLLTADEVADFLCVSKAWVYDQTRRNRMPHVRLGRYVRYRRGAIDGWIAALEDASTRRA